ncbi:MAG: pilus assembly protein TadG-related protein [Acidimicrobiales bacterium]
MRRRRGRSARCDQAQVTPLIAIAIMLVAGVGALIVAVGGVLADRTVARTAADAAALVAAVDTDEATAEMARANGAELVAILRNGDQVEVEVRVGRVTARARAEATRDRAPGPDGTDPAGPARSTTSAIP